VLLLISVENTSVKKENSVTAFFRRQYKRATKFIKSKPFTAFLVALLLLFLVILAGSFLNKPVEQKQAAALTKSVHTYKIGSSPKVSFQAKIDKAGVIKIVALAPGIVQHISVKEGDTVNKGTQLLTMSTNYQGGSAPAYKHKSRRNSLRMLQITLFYG